MNSRFLRRLNDLIDQLEQAHHTGNDAEFDRITRQVRELLGNGWVYG